MTDLPLEIEVVAEKGWLTLYLTRGRNRAVFDLDLAEAKELEKLLKDGEEEARRKLVRDNP